jgi:hypothetical protein
MTSAHTHFEIINFAKQHFPNLETVIVPPVFEWNYTEKVSVFTKETNSISDFHKIIGQVENYTDTGYLMLDVLYYVVYPSKPKPVKPKTKSATYFIKAPVKREDLALILTALIGQKRTFNPLDVGLNIPKEMAEEKEDFTVSASLLSVSLETEEAVEPHLKRALTVTSFETLKPHLERYIQTF